MSQINRSLSTNKLEVYGTTIAWIPIIYTQGLTMALKLKYIPKVVGNQNFLLAVLDKIDEKNYILQYSC